MVKVRGRNSNRKTVKQTVKYGRKISGDDAARLAWVHGARRQQFAAASRFWSIPNLMPRSTVTRVWLTEWAHLGQLCGTLTSDNLFFFFFCCFVSVVWQDSDGVQSVTQGTWYSGRSSMLSSDSWLIDIGERSHPNPMHRRPIRCSSATSKTGNGFGWSFFFALWRRCARSQLHMNSVVLVESQGSCALVRIARSKNWQEGQHDLHSPPQPIDWWEHTIGAVHDRNLPTRSLQVPESYGNFLWHLVKVRSIVTGLTEVRFDSACVVSKHFFGC